ncbi:divergent polysaccharide deacetylase family protein [Sinirhodobacter sp. WL0062]|uniref:Divergent polysaccharide deacetylase family protein n=1 Tax=Rhodobacter flavimaris TaxID=2907145 RepID=A0ABS8YU54_9RHOB|nr:divergent polysaccharide deacetylase family protein [Sinirhodobacter sp. WL0062]MCE5971981.1 divergent polysaccharide deacetylase family protein [Sinirhodobacter sp. WL0062]
MMRGVLGGLVTGGVVTVLGIGALSLITPLPQQAPVPVPAVEPPAPDAAPTPLPAEPAMPTAELPATQPVAEAAPQVLEGAPQVVEGAPATPAMGEAAEAPGKPADLSPRLPPPEGVPSVVNGGTRMAQIEAEETTAPHWITTDPGARPEARETRPEPQPVGDVPAAALENAPEGESPMPVPPPGEVFSPELAPAEDGAPSLPRVFSVDGGQGAGGAAFSTAPGVVTDRLPRIAAEPSEGQAEPVPVATDPDLPAFQRYAQAFIAPPGVPLLSVVLVDVGTQAGGLDRNTLKMLDFPVSIAIDPNRADAREAAADYRARGLEVAILAQALPENASATDLEVAVEAWRAAIPEAVAVVEPAQPMIQNNRKLAEQLVTILNRAGLGLITQRQGLNPAAQLAQAAAVPEVEVWRVLDAEREPGDAIERALTRAAFEAQRDGRVTIMLSAWPESVAGLSGWAARVGQGIALAPVTTLVQN